MLSQLSKGYGSWTAGYVDPYFGEKKERECTLPEIDQDSHFHGVTIGSRSGRSTAMSWATSKRSREPTMDGIPLPKTYTTRKGALQLFVGPDDLENDNDDDDDDNEDESYPLKPKYVQIKRTQGQELIDLSLKLGTMERLARSVLQFGDEDYDHEHTSVTDNKNKAFLKFLHSVDEARTKSDIDTHVQPGGDLKSYLKDLKTSAGSRFSNMYVSKSRESVELQAILRGLDNSTWPMSYSQDAASDKSGNGQFTRPVSRVSSRGPSPGPPSTPRSLHQVLSAKKVAASIKSGSYLGRPSSRISAVDDDLSENEQGGAGHITPASVMRPTWTPTDSTDDYLIDTRDKFYVGEEDGDSSEDGRKRRRFKERSFLTNNSQLYQGRNARKGEGQRAMEVKVTTKGDGDSASQKMSQIEEELADSSEAKKHVKKGKSEKDFGNDEDSDKIIDSWAVKVSQIKQINVSEDELEEETHEPTSPDVIEMELDDKDVISDKVAVKVEIRPESAKSAISSVSSVSARTASTRAMSIVTLQSMNTTSSKQLNNNDKYNLNKPRGTYAYDPDKGLIRTGKNRRKSEPFIHARKNSTHSIEQSKSPNTQKRNAGAEKTASLHSDGTNGRVVQGLEDTTNQKVQQEVDEQLEKTLEVDNVEPQQTDQEDYLLDNIDECNEEIQQIEAQADATDRDSDSDSCMDEEVIKVVLEGQNNNDILDEDHHDYESVIVDDILQEDHKHAEEGMKEESKSRSSEVNEDEGMVETEDILGSTGDELELVMDGEDDKTVDEIGDENASEVKSTKSGKSGRKTQSKRSKSVLESEDGGDEYKLPVLDSDKYEEKEAHTIPAELEALGPKKSKKGSKVYPLLPPGPKPKAPAEKQKIPDHLQDALNRRASESRENLEQDLERMSAMVGATLSGPTLEAVGEGLTEEELEIAKQILQQKLDEAKGQLEGKPSTKSKAKKPVGKGGKKTGKKKNDPSDDKTKEEMDRDAIRARRDHEQQLREQEAADLQRKIAENKRLLQQQADQTSAKSKELLDEMERLEREAADMQQAEDEARQMLADERKKQREERELRRKADLERKKQEAMDRRERERKEMEGKRRKEMEMMEKIADSEMRRRMREEEERRIDEEERLAQERYEAEMQEAQRHEEEEEERLKEMERQAEEEAMQRLIDEREAAERERRRIREEEEAFREAEHLRMEKMAEEHRKLEDERSRLQGIEDAKREAERQNLLKLRQMEEEARFKMQEEIEKRRSDALTRRDFNLESKQHVDKLRHYQGITRAWTFSYFVHWPRETYERPIGTGDPRKNVKISNPAPKKPDDAPAGGEDIPPAIVP